MNSITANKGGDLSDEPNFAKEYNAFVINGGLSMFPDTVIAANEMNRLHFLPPEQQYKYLYCIIRKMFRKGGKWPKTEHSKETKAVMEYYECNSSIAKQYMQVLPDSEIKRILKLVEEK